MGQSRLRKKRRLPAVLGVWLCLPCFAVAQVRAPAPNQKPAAQATIQSGTYIHAPAAGHHFPEGTAFHYRADWRLLGAGVMSIRMERNSRGQEHIVGTADSTGFVARLYHLHDLFETNFDPISFCSSGITKHAEEGIRLRETKISFDYARGKSVLDEFNPKNGQRKHLENELPACAVDLLTGLFYAATLPLDPGMTYSFPINDGGKTTDLHLHAEAREQVKTDAGTFNAIRVQPTTDAEVMRGRGKIWIWYSDDAERMPVQMRGKMGWGTLTVTLVRVDRPQQASAKP